MLALSVQRCINKYHVATKYFFFCCSQFHIYYYFVDSDVQLQWNTGDDKTNRSFLKHVEYKDGQIVIEDAGTYYFYSFITFRSMQVQNETFLNHYVYRATEGERINKAEMIFMAKQMRQKGNLEYQTSLLAGIVNFESRDRVFTEVSDVSAVYRSSLTNYMGLFKL